MSVELTNFGSYIVGIGLGNTGADVGAALNADIASTPPFAVCVLPPYLFHTSVPIIVDSGRLLQGVTGGFCSDALDRGSCICGDLAVNPVVKLDGLGGSLSTNVKGIMITRIAGEVPNNVSGLQCVNLNNSVIEDVIISRQGWGLDFFDHNVGVRSHRVITTAINHAHVLLRGQAIELDFDNCRHGMNGTNDVPCTAYFYVAGGGWDTLKISRGQWNQAAAAVTGAALVFDGHNGVNPNGIILIENLHAENFVGSFVTAINCTAPILRMTVAASQINAGCPFFGAGGAFSEFVIAGARIMTSDFTLDRQSNVTVTGGVFAGPAVINAAPGCVLTGNRFYSNVLLQGACGKSVFVGNSVQGVLTNNSTGMQVGLNN